MAHQSAWNLLKAQIIASRVLDEVQMIPRSTFTSVDENKEGLRYFPSVQAVANLF